MIGRLRDFPLVIFIVSLVGLWLSAQAGVFVRKKLRPVEEDERKDWATLEAATLTLLGMIIAFSFSMAISRYDQRKNYEAEEANAIGTEYARAGFLPPRDADRIRRLLKDYLRQRVAFYETRNEDQIQQINAVTSQLETELWATIEAIAAAQPTPVAALAASGMNDVLNDRAYTQAAWWNRIPAAAWDLMISIAVLCNLLLGYGTYRTGTHLFLVFPLALSISFLLISDLDAPRGGVIRIMPNNLISLAQSLGN
ncbi:MAG TPA: hypothetical protein VGK96_13625 [Candidatus Sulfotelmatobacter sp.]